jgi:SAM-dependent methyltransferase
MSKKKLVTKKKIVPKKSYYDQKYFEYQEKIGYFGGQENLYKFQEFIKRSDNVLDFGCGGGYMLAQMKCKNKLGVEINPVARKVATKQSIPVLPTVKKVKDNWAHVIVSNHTLEHTFRPLDELKSLYPKLKKKGKIIFVVPYEVKMEWHPQNVNQHLYTWSPMCLGNLFTTAGYQVQKAEVLKSQWPPYYMGMRKLLGEKLFRIVCQMYGRLRGNLYQTRVIAIKK